jgi:DNA repair protein RadC
MKNAVMENTQAIARIEGQFEYLVAEVTRREEEEFQSLLMATGHYMIDEDDFSNFYHEHVPAITIFESEEIVDSNQEEEKEEHLEHTAPRSNPKSSNDKKMSTEAHSFITIPLETFHEPQASILQCLKEPSYAKTVKDLCTQPRKFRNHRPKKIL